MSDKNRKLLIALFIAIGHLILGNIVGIYSEGGILELLFIPYSFIAGMSAFAGWDGLSLLLEMASFAFFFAIIYALISFFSKDNTTS